VVASSSWRARTGEIQFLVRPLVQRSDLLQDEKKCVEEVKEEKEVSRKKLLNQNQKKMCLPTCTLNDIVIFLGE